MSDNKVRVRVENIGDLYDGAKAKTVDLLQLVKHMFYQYNDISVKQPAFQINEMSLTGNM